MIQKIQQSDIHFRKIWCVANLADCIVRFNGFQMLTARYTDNTNTHPLMPQANSTHTIILKILKIPDPK